MGILGGLRGKGPTSMSPFLRARIEKAMEALSQIEVPGYDVDIVSSGVATRIRVSYKAPR